MLPNGGPSRPPPKVAGEGASHSARGGRAPLTSNASDWECDLDNRRGSGFTYFATQAAIYANAREKESDAVLY